MRHNARPAFLRKGIICLSLAACCLPSRAHAQQAYIFREGLASGRAHQYGREAVVTDTLQHEVILGRLQQPKEGLVWFEEGAAVKRWQRVQADSAGYFRHPAMNNGYLHLSFDSPAEQPALLTVAGHAMVYVNGEPRAGDPYSAGWMRLPVRLRKGRNDFLVRSGFTGRQGGVAARLETGVKALSLGREDATLPHIVIGEPEDSLWAGIVCLNAGASARVGLRIEAELAGASRSTALPVITAMATRKMPVLLPRTGDGGGEGPLPCRFRLYDGTRLLDSMTLVVQRVSPARHRSHTFLSGIDGSVQYYAVAPQLGGPSADPALYLSVHGAGVEAIGQARAYEPKPDGPLVAPTNRRPRGFNWEDWGRIDALEVLDIATRRFRPDPARIYLTGHSMGGHGTWFLGATYAGRWAAIAPCAGYPVLQAYGSADGRIPTTPRNPAHAMLLRASHPSNVIELSRNYLAGGVYVFHGDDDRVVPVDFARQMRKLLAEFHGDFSYYEYPGGSHWFGNISVDWPPLFAYLNQHRNRRPEEVLSVDFTTASPAVSGAHHWLTVLQQERSLDYSRVRLRRDTARGVVSGTTQNVRAFSLSREAFGGRDRLMVEVDGSRIALARPAEGGVVLLRNGDGWRQGAAPDPAQKGLLRGAGFKEAFHHRMLFVYGTKGTPQENAWAYRKARYDAESWYYRGNGAVDVIPDVDFDSARHAGRGVVLYGNAATNAQYDRLMRGCPVRIGRDAVTVGGKTYAGGTLGGYLVWPNPADPRLSVAVIGGSGLSGMMAAEANQYFAGGSGFPDFMVFDASLLREGAEGVRAAGFYSHDWRLDGDHVAR